MDRIQEKVKSRVLQREGQQQESERLLQEQQAEQSLKQKALSRRQEEQTRSLAKFKEMTRALREQSSASQASEEQAKRIGGQQLSGSSKNATRLHADGGRQDATVRNREEELRFRSETARRVEEAIKNQQSVSSKGQSSNSDNPDNVMDKALTWAGLR